MEGGPKEKSCPVCGAKRIRVSRYEWFLADALKRQLAETDRTFSVAEQWPLPDHRGFTWYFDLAVRVKGASIYGGVTELIEVQGPTHANQPNYSGAGGGYTRDYDKHWEAFSVRRLNKAGYHFSEVAAEDCRLSVVNGTARVMVAALLSMADHLC